MGERSRVLVIKLSAFGDFIQALGPMKAIRAHHKDAHITLLTTTPFEKLARESGYCDDVVIDPRPKAFHFQRWARLIGALRAIRPERVYDLMCNDRTALYFRIMRGFHPSLEWVGTAPGASHRDKVSDKRKEHAITRHARMLGLAGIHDVTYDDLGWVRCDVTRFSLPKPYVLLMPGCAAPRFEKRWPAERYGAVAQWLVWRGLTPVVIGTGEEKNLADVIRSLCPQAIDLCGKTEILDLVGLARAAAGAIGNDTGTMHLSGPTGCPLLVLFSSVSSPLLHAPLGPRVLTHQVDRLADLDVDTVLKKIETGFFRAEESSAA
jgi:ADP-heptose:LPS heptosyltransferase